MARSKWISIGAKAQLERAAKAAVTASPPTVQLDSDAKKIGLENFGNTCYANSVLQALYFCTPFRDLLLRDVEVEAIAPVAPVLQPTSPVIPPATTKVTSPLVPQRWRPDRKPSTSPQGPEALPTITAPAVVAPAPPLPPTLFSALQSLFLSISQNPNEKGTISPRAFIDKLKELNPIFRSTMHQDAHEFLNYLLNQVMEEIGEERKQAQSSGDDLSNSVVTLGSKAPTATNSSNSGTHPSDATLVHKLFEGVLTSETRCLTCEIVSSRDESFLDLSIDIEQNSSVTACLRQFSASEMLCQRNKFFCDSCCDLQEAEKRMKIKKLPNVLALHLKRFKYQEEADRYIKLAYRVAFPFELRLFNTVDDMDDADRLYNLFGIVVHIGNGPHHGHYVSIIKTVGTWLVFDDDNVYPIPEGDIPKYFGDSVSGSAYVLYYQAVDMDLSALGLPSATPAVPPEAFINNIPPLSRSPNPILPPGLHHVSPGGIDVQDLHPTNPFDDPPTPVHSDKPTIILQQPVPPSTHYHTTDLAPAPSPHITSAGSPAPNTPSLGNTILRHIPSLSAMRGAGTSTTPSSPVLGGTDAHKDKSPRPSTSTPSFVASMLGSSSNDEVPPPVPALPPSVGGASSLPIHLVPVPPGDSEKEKETKSKSPVGWFKKRKSLRITEKLPRQEPSLMRDLPTSPAVAEEAEPGSAPLLNGAHAHGHGQGQGHGHVPFLHPLRRHTEHNISSHSASSTTSAYQHPEALSLQTMVAPAGSVDARLSGVEDPTTAHHPAPEESGSSSPSIGSLRYSAQGGGGGGGSSTTHSNSHSNHYSSASGQGQVLDHPPGRMSSLPHPPLHRRSATDHDMSNRAAVPGPSSSTLPPASPATYSSTYPSASNPAYTSASNPSSASASSSSPLTASSSPVPPSPFNPNNARTLPLTPSRGHRPSISNGHLFANGADALPKGQTAAAAVPSTPDGGGDDHPHMNHVNSQNHTNHTNHAPLSPLSSPPPPPPPPSSMAASMGANLSSGSTTSASSNFKRATRKLSITAPMLGFGRKPRQ